MRNEADEITDIYVHAVEVTEQVNARREIEEIANLNRTITDNALTSLFIMDANNRCTFMNPSAHKMTGYGLSELKESKKTLYETLHPEHVLETSSISRCLIERYRRVKKVVTGEEIFVRKNGTTYHALCAISPIILDGVYEGSVMEARDISDRKVIEANLAHSKQMFDALFDSAVVAIALVTLDGTILQANKTFLKLFKYTKADLKAGITSAQMAASDSIEITKAIYESLRRTGEAEPVNKKYTRKDGSEFPALVGAAMLPGSKDQFMAFILDMSETEKLKELNVAKDEFVAIASHQLRTPATSVKQYIGIVMDAIAGPVSDEQLNYLQIANKANNRQLAIIDDLLKTAQIDTKGFKLNLAKKSLTPIIEASIAQYQPVLSTRHQEIAWSRPTEDALVLIDEVEISTVICNIIENASKYSPENSTITVSLKKNKDFMELSVRDHGVGISKEDQTKIFDKFTRITNVLSDTVSGNGLGLYWVKRIIDLHKGRILVQAPSGGGTRFSIRLPI
jgi:PAS domain S-box-containing protein